MSRTRLATCGVLTLVIIGIVVLENTADTPAPTATTTTTPAPAPASGSGSGSGSGSAPALARLETKAANCMPVNTVVVDERTVVEPNVTQRPADESRPTTSATRGSPEDDELRRLDTKAATTCFLSKDEKRVYDIVVRRFANTTATDLPEGMLLAPANRPAPPLRPGAVSPAIPRVMMQTNKRRYVKLSMRVAMESWLRRNPDYGYEYYSDDGARQYICAHYPPVYMTVFNLIRAGAFKADFFRMMWLHQQGGVYIDVDSYAGAPLSEAICPSDKFFGPVTPTGRAARSGPYTIFQAFLGATAGHPVLKLVLDSGIRYVMQRSYYGYKFNGAGGPASVYRALAMYLNKTEIVFGHLPEQSMTILFVSFDDAACRRLSIKAETPNVRWCPAMRSKGSLNTATKSQKFSYPFWNDHYGLTKTNAQKDPEYHNTTESYTSTFMLRNNYNTSIPDRFDADIPAIQFTRKKIIEVVAPEYLADLFDGNFSSVVQLLPTNSIPPTTPVGTLIHLSGPPGYRIQCVLAFESRREVDFLYGSLSLVARGASSDGEAEDVVERVVVSRNDGTRVHRLPLGGPLFLGKLKRGVTVRLSGTFSWDQVVLSALLFFDSPDCSGLALRVGTQRAGV